MGLDEISLDTADIALAFDHDGNVHTQDIGRDYLLDVLPFRDPDAFVDEVYRLREQEDMVQDAYVNGESYSAGEELGIFLAQHAVPQDDVLERAYGDGFRDGFPTFLNDLVTADIPAAVVSAGDEDFLQTFYGNHDQIAVDVPIAGTKQYWENGDTAPYAAGILNGCGRDKKPVRYQELMEGAAQDHRLIASGDSSGDAALLSYAQDTGGLAISTGPGAADHADVVVDGDGWYGQIAATLAYTGLMNDADTDDIAAETAAYLDEVADRDRLSFNVRTGNAAYDRDAEMLYDDTRTYPGEAVVSLVEEVQDVYNDA